MRPRVGLMPKTPQQEDGMRMEPPPSVAWARGTIRAATAAAVATQLAAAVAYEYQLHLLSKAGRVVDIVQGDGAAAEETDV